MNRTPHYDSYVKILEEELIPAMGCTEPIAIALAAAKARAALDAVPERCRVEVSGNIIKNVKAVTVPNTGGLKASRPPRRRALPPDGRTWSWRCCPR